MILNYLQFRYKWYIFDTFTEASVYKTKNQLVNNFNKTTMQTKPNIKKWHLGSGKDYTSILTFDADNDIEKDIIIGIISNEAYIIKELEDYIEKKLYDSGPENLLLFLESGILVAYRKNFEWFKLQEDISSLLNLKALKDTTLNGLIDDHINKNFFLPQQDERQETIDFILKSTFQKIAELIAEDPDYLEHIEWRDLERILGEVLFEIGFSVKVTPPSKDGGKDIIASIEVSNKKYSFIIELKHWRSGKKVGKESVEKFLRVVINEQRSGGLFLASYGFTENCREALASFKQYRVNLGDGEKLYSFFQLYQQKKNGKILVPEELISVLSSGL